ncbi:Mu-like prophage DNA circulation protein [Klebsiella pneumoniae]|uniref:Mu-like prophage DNA circulation protein n=1 Tax=Klebsiella pneumoniae TaxID=573 RepID=A0A378C7M1_KLEPN|nr:Mu-like prophage DNA circulation protein [Klebsiella pneumoniae]
MPRSGAYLSFSATSRALAAAAPSPCLPKKEVGWTEDHGAVLTQQQINAILLGSDYIDQMNRLLAALNTAGPGELVHPWFGVQKVQVGRVTHRLSTKKAALPTFL